MTNQPLISFKCLNRFRMKELKSAFSKNDGPVVIQYVLQGEAYFHLVSQESRGRLLNFNTQVFR